MLLRKKGQMFTQRILISWHLASDEQIMSVMFGVSFALPLSSQPCIILELPLPLPGCSSWSCCSRPWLESMPRNLDLKPLEHVAKSSIFCYSWVCRITLGIFSVFSFFSILIQFGSFDQGTMKILIAIQATQLRHGAKIKTRSSWAMNRVCRYSKQRISMLCKRVCVWKPEGMRNLVSQFGLFISPWWKLLSWDLSRLAKWVL